MGLLSNDNFPKSLLSGGWWSDGWGSPHTRQTKNTLMYETIHYDDYSRQINLMYFPPEWEGVGYCKGTLVRPRGQVWIQYKGESYFMDVQDELDIKVFEQSVLGGQVKPFDSFKYKYPYGTTSNRRD